MTVSVIIPCLDAADYLEATLLSLRNQTHRDVQIILVDNGSRDDSIAIAERYEEVEILRVAEPGAARARRAGVTHAKHDRLMFLDADDVIAPDTLDALDTALDAALGNSDGNIACCPWYRYILANEAWQVAPPSCAKRLAGQDDLEAWLTGWYHPPCSVLWSREAYDRSGGWDPAIGVNDDGDVMMRGLAAGNRIHLTRTGSAYYRRLPPGRKSLSDGGRTKAGLRSRMTVLRRIEKMLTRRRSGHRYALALVTAFERLADDAAENAPATEATARKIAGRLRSRAGIGRRLLNVAARQVTFAAEKAQSRTSLATGGVDRTQSDEMAGTRLMGLPSRWPLVSVVIPAHNRQKTIARTIASVQAQDYPRIEIIVVDDGSTDATTASALASNDQRVRVISMTVNRGAGAARNAGIASARGDYVAFLDSDDEWLPGKLRLQVAMMEALEPSVGMMLSGIETVQNEGTVATVPTHEGWIHDVLLVRNTLHGGSDTALVRREVFLLIGGFDTSLPAIEDWDFFVRVSRFFQIRTVAAVLARYFDDATEVGEQQVRLSRDFDRNMSARRRFFDLHAVSLRENRVDHLFLLTSAERSLRSPTGDIGSGLKYAAKALARRPLAAYTYRWLGTTLPSLVAERFSSRLKKVINS